MGSAPLHVSTLRAHAPAALLSQLTRLASEYGGRGHTLLFALSANFPKADDLQAVVNQLNTFHGHHPAIKRTKAHRKMGRTVGCLTDAVPGDARLSCAVALFDSARCTPFHSALAGRVQPQVGRWHSFRKQGDEDGSSLSMPEWTESNAGSKPVDWDSVWQQRGAAQPSSAASVLPFELQNIPPYLINTLLSFSSPHPDALTRALSSFLLDAPTSASTALTLTAAPTHFITGRPVTLFLDGEIYGDGAVGVALLREHADSEGDPGYRTEFVGVQRLGVPVVVTSNEGNMINALGDANPTRMLLSALGVAGLGGGVRTVKEDAQFALGVLDASGEIVQTYKITAGDPASRGGSLALDAARAPAVGTRVQFLHFPTTTETTTTPKWTLPTSSKGTKLMAFMTVPEPTSASDLAETRAQENVNVKDESNVDVDVAEGEFVVASTQGFVVSRVSGLEKEEGEGEPWACSLSGGVGVVEWVGED